MDESQMVGMGLRASPKLECSLVGRLGLCVHLSWLVFDVKIMTSLVSMNGLTPHSHDHVTNLCALVASEEQK